MVEWKKLSDVAVIKNGKDYKRLSNGTIPVYGTGGIMTYVNQYASDKPSVLLPRKGSVENIFYVDEPFWTVDTLYWTDIDTSIISPKFLFMSLQRYNLKEFAYGGARPSLSQQILYNLEIPVPSLSEQNRIVGILDTFTASIENLKEQITQRRKQFEHYRDQLLDLEVKEGVEMNSVAHFVKERILANELTAQNYTSVENLLKDKAGRKDAENVPSEGSWIRYQRGDVLIGNIRPYLRKIWLSDREGGTNGDVIVIRANDALFPEFMFYCLASESFFLYYNQALKDGKMPRGEKNRVLSYVIPSIRKEEQSRIVSILDTFEASIANLEAQLSQREKQYEYYRNKLLTFE